MRRSGGRLPERDVGQVDDDVGIFADFFAVEPIGFARVVWRVNVVGFARVVWRVNVIDIALESHIAQDSPNSVRWAVENPTSSFSIRNVTPCCCTTSRRTWDITENTSVAVPPSSD